MNAKLAALTLVALCARSAMLCVEATPVASGTSEPYTESERVVLTVVHVADLHPITLESPLWPATPTGPIFTPTYTMATLSAVATPTGIPSCVFFPNCTQHCVDGDGAVLIRRICV